MGVMLNEDRFGCKQVTLNIAQVTAGTSNEQTFTIPGLQLNDFVALCKPTLHAGLAIANARVKAKDTLAIQFINTTGSPITAGSESYLLFYYRAEKLLAPIS